MLWALMADPKLFLGAPLDSEGAFEESARVQAKAAHLCTHGVIVGMTGSGKTGLGIVLLEEALRNRIPALIIDPKGDMGNLALRFPELSAQEFAPWVGSSAEATSVAELWRKGLSKWGLGPADIQKYCEDSRVEVYTPGSSAGLSLNILGSLQAPQGDLEGQHEELLAEIQAFVTGLLTLIDVDADPLASREFILLTNLIEHAWMAGRSLDLPTLIAQIQDPPLRKLGVFELESFFGAKDRMQLAMRINALLANPAFATWISGAPLDPQQLLFSPDGTPKAAVMNIAHLDDQQRQFVVTLLLSKMVTWTRRQPGTDQLRALIYMDEVFGFAPPTKNPPSKTPILTILKQARAHGVGMVLSTQNPVDLDYKAMSNAGMWLIGRLQTERDKSRILEGLRSASGDVDVAQLSADISHLKKREFVLHSTRAKQPQKFSSRWAMSYLRGPLTLAEIKTLAPEAQGLSQTNPASPSTSPAASPPATSPADTLAEDESLVAPQIADSTRVVFLDPASELIDKVDADPASQRYELGLAVRVGLTFDERVAALDHREEWEALYFPLCEPFESSSQHRVDYDERDFRSDTPAGARFVAPPAPVHLKRYIQEAQRQIKSRLYRNETLKLWANKTIKLYSQVDESEADFRLRCQKAADGLADQSIAKLHDKAKRDLQRLEKKLDRAQRKLDTAEAAASTASRDEIVSGVGAVLGALFGGRRGSLAGKASGFSSRRGRTSRSKQKVESAEDEIASLQQEIENLQEELEDTVDQLRADFQEQAENIETFEVSLEKSDIQIDDIVAVWVPVAGRS